MGHCNPVLQHGNRSLFGFPKINPTASQLQAPVARKKPLDPGPAQQPGVRATGWHGLDPEALRPEATSSKGGVLIFHLLKVGPLVLQAWVSEVDYVVKDSIDKMTDSIEKQPRKRTTSICLRIALISFFVLRDSINSEHVDICIVWGANFRRNSKWK